MGERGESLSVGERQLVALARAIAEPTQLSASLVGRASTLFSLNRPTEGLPDAEEALRIILESGARTYESAANITVDGDSIKLA